MGKQKAPAAPDYTPIAQANAESARYSYELGKEQLAWAKEQYGKDSALTGRVVESALATQAQTNDQAAKDRARYEQLYQPQEDALLKEATDYATPARTEMEAGRATAGVSQQFSQARNAAQSRLESFGVDPSQVRSAALDVSTRTQEAAARASAANQSRLNTEATGRALRSEAINIGKGYPGQVAQSYNTALQAGNAGVNSNLANTATGAQTMGTGAQWQGLGNQAVGQWGNALNQGYQNQLGQYNANRQSSSGLGSALGLGFGMLTSTIPGGSLLGKMFEEGGMVPDEGQGAIPDGALPPSNMNGQHDGIAVDPRMSPSQGAIPDDVPARVNVGEFIVPKDVVRFKGEEFFQKLIEGSRTKAGAVTAKPRTAALPTEAPAINT